MISDDFSTIRPVSLPGGTREVFTDTVKVAGVVVPLEATKSQLPSDSAVAVNGSALPVLVTATVCGGGGSVLATCVNVSDGAPNARFGDPTPNANVRRSDAPEEFETDSSNL